MKKPKFKAEINEKIEVCIKGHSYIHIANNMEEARGIATRLEKDANKKWENDNDKELKHIEFLKMFECYIKCYINNILNYRLEHIPKEEKIRKKEFKLVIDELKGLVNKKLTVKYEQSNSQYGAGCEHYIKKVLKDRK